MKKIPQELEPLVPILDALQQLMKEIEVQGVIIGGAAICFLGQPRLTADIDAMLLLTNDDLPRLLVAAQHSGFVPRVKNIEQFARQNRLVLLRHAETGADVDLSMGAMPLEVEMVKRSQMWRYRKLRVPLPTVEDLIILKAIAHRPKDMLDIANLIEIYPKLDHARIKKWVREYADLMEMPELWTDIEPLIRKQHKQKGASQ